MDLIHPGTVLEVEGEVGAGLVVTGGKQGDAVAGVGRLQVGPVIGIPGQAQAEPLVEGLGPGHVLDPHGHMAQSLHGHGRFLSLAPF